MTQASLSFIPPRPRTALTKILQTGDTPLTNPSIPGTSIRLPAGMQNNCRPALARTIQGGFCYAASQDLVHTFSRAHGIACFSNSSGAVSTYKSGVESDSLGKTHRPAASERLGPRPQFRRTLLGQRSRHRLVDNLQWSRRQAGFGSPDSRGWRRPG